MRYVVAFRKFLLVAFLWWVGYRAANALDFWVQTDRGYKAGQIQVAVAHLNAGT